MNSVGWLLVGAWLGFNAGFLVGVSFAVWVRRRPDDIPPLGGLN